VLVAAHVALRKAPAATPDSEELASLFDGNPLVGGRVGDGVASVRADFRIHADGFSRFLIDDISLTPRQAGRMVQRLLEVETYLMRALLTLPVARAPCRCWPMPTASSRRSSTRWLRSEVRTNPPSSTG
jgi:uncharacterized membrane-anchored protein